MSDRVQQLVKEEAAARKAADKQWLAGVRDRLWELQRELFDQAIGEEMDLEVTACLVEIARRSIFLQLASHNWAGALYSCYAMTVATANVISGAHSDDRHVPRLVELLRDVTGNVAPAAAHAAHRRGDPAAALQIIESLTSVVPGARMRRTAANVVDRRMKASPDGHAEITEYHAQWQRTIRESVGRSASDQILAQLAVEDRPARKLGLVV
jgi:hypothetical protein